MSPVLTGPRHWRIGTKLTVSYLTLSLAMGIASFLVVAQLFVNLATAEARDSVALIIDRVELELVSTIDRVLATAQAIAESEAVIIATGTSFMREAEQEIANSAVLETLPRTIGSDGLIARMAVVGQNGLIVTTHDAALAEADARSRYWYREILQSSFPPVVYAPRPESLIFGETEEPMVTLGVPIRDRISDARVGVVVLEMPEARLRQILSDRLDTTGYLFVRFRRTGFTLSRDARPDTTYLSQLTNRESVDERLAERNRDMIVTRALPFPGLSLGAIISLDRLYEDSALMLRRGMLVMFAGATATAVAALILSRSFTAPITALRNTMAAVESGDLTARAGFTSQDEFGHLARSFDSMIEQIGVLLENVRMDQVQIREEQLRRLQEQINPHFLYNTLDTISWMARNGRVESIPDLVSSLTTVFRVGLSRGQEVVPVRDEVAHVESYLRIQAHRYGNKLRYRIAVADGAMVCRTPKVVLQPLVENAIYHGLRERTGTGLIEIVGRVSPAACEIEVRDNGAGISQERLEQVRAELYSTGSPSGVSFGLKNVHDRIQMTFGDRFGVRVHGMRGHGTSVTVRIPVEASHV